MSHYQWPEDKIKSYLGNNSVVLVALDGGKIVGTASLSIKHSDAWYTRGNYGYLCFAGVIPEYSGRGIYYALTEKREQVAISKGISVLSFDTHRKNDRIQKVAKRNGFRKVRFFRAKSGDHFNIVMTKWLNGCPFPKFYCSFRYILSIIRALIHIS